MPKTDADREAVRAAAIATVLAQCFTDEERHELITEAMKPLFRETTTTYGEVQRSPFSRAIEQALENWTNRAVVEYCSKPDILADLTRLLEKECARLIKERIPSWVDEMVKKHL